MSFEFDERLPIYLQIMDYIKIRIITGELKPGEKLQSIREMAEILSVNPNTIQRAFLELERENLTFTQRGMGTFVTRDQQVLENLKQEKALRVLEKFLKDMKGLGFSLSEVCQILYEKIEGEKT
jgi:GntR family transcriptional regulator